MFSGLRAGAAGLDLLQSLAATGQLFQDGFDGGGPDKGFRIVVPGDEEGFDRCLQIRHAEENAAAYGLAVEVAEPSLHQIQPAGTGRNEVRYEPGMPFQPFPYLVMFVGAVIVHDQM